MTQSPLSQSAESGRANWLPQKGTRTEPMCINCFCPSHNGCALFCCDPISDPEEGASIFVDPEPVDGKCALFEPFTFPQGIETGTAETARLGPKDESPVPAGNAPVSDRLSPNQEGKQ